MLGGIGGFCMKLFANAIPTFPVARIVFDDHQEFIEFELLANQLGMGRDWPITMLRDYLSSYKESSRVGSKPFSWGDSASALSGK